MSILVWDAVGERVFETGINKGVFYKEDGLGVVWNGLTSVDEGLDTEVDPLYFDGVKINDIVTIGDVKGTLRAFTYPDELLEYEGTLEDQVGFYLLQQPLNTFGLSYQTRIGDDIDGARAGYKIHLLYNITAVPAQRSYKTLSLDTNPTEFEWDITSIPEDVEEYLPTSHVIFDSRKCDPFMLVDLENILYGSEDSEAMLPSLKALSAFVRKWNRFIITNLGNGRWSAYARDEGVITMLDADTFQIVTDTATYLDADTYEISSSELMDEDI